MEWTKARDERIKHARVSSQEVRAMQKRLGEMSEYAHLPKEKKNDCGGNTMSRDTGYECDTGVIMMEGNIDFELHIGDKVYWNLVDNVFTVVKYGTIGEGTKVILGCSGLKGGLRTRMLDYKNDMDKTYRLTDFYPQGAPPRTYVIGRDGNEKEPIPLRPVIYDGMKVIGVDRLSSERKAAMFVIHYPNKIQKLGEDKDEWATFCVLSQENVFQDMTSVEELTKFVNNWSGWERFKHIEFSVVPGLNNEEGK